MTNQEILQKAIEKAVGSGYKLPNGLEYSPRIGLYDPYGNNDSDDLQGIYMVYLIFSHDFAKAFWGEDLICYICKKTEKEGHLSVCSKKCSSADADYPRWRWHIQQMVISEDPIKYLEQFI